MPRKRIQVSERKLGRERAMGLAWLDDNLIEIDPRYGGREWLYVLLHELLHHAFPDMPEEEVVRASRLQCDHLWRLNVRRTYA